MDLAAIANAVREDAQLEGWDLLVDLAGDILYVAEAHSYRRSNRWSITLANPHTEKRADGKRHRVEERRRFDGELTRVSLSVLEWVTELLPQGGLGWDGTTD